MQYYTIPFVRFSLYHVINVLNITIPVCGHGNITGHVCGRGNMEDLFMAMATYRTCVCVAMATYRIYV